jgi:Uma2 family endonuclease
VSAITARHQRMTVEEFLAAEPRHAEKHEYLGGVIYAMAGASTEHNVIAMNLYGMLHAGLRGHRCQGFGSDMKVRLSLAGDTYFYYPDAMVVCEKTGLGSSWCECPSVLFEILSPSTRDIDDREKRMAYRTIASLDAYVVIESEQMEVVVEYRESEGWRREVFTGKDARFRLPTVEIELALGELYERLDFAASNG